MKAELTTRIVGSGGRARQVHVWVRMATAFAGYQYKACTPDRPLRQGVLFGGQTRSPGSHQPIWFESLAPARLQFQGGVSVRSAFVAAAVLAITLAAPSLSSAGNDVRLSHDDNTADYVSLYTQNTGTPYDDPTLQECRVSHGRQNEPSVAIDPRNSSVILGSSNDYCGVYQPAGAAIQSAIGPIWLGYYRSQDGGVTFRSSLVPGYPDDTSPYAALAHIRTASAGDPVIAWDNHGRVFMGSESSGDPALSKKTFGDVWVARFDNPDGENGATINDGKRFRGSEIVAHGSSAPNLLGVFQDKTALEVDRTGGACDGYVYFAWARFNANGSNAI